jgi:hypothetical protein
VAVAQLVKTFAGFMDLERSLPVFTARNPQSNEPSQSGVLFEISFNTVIPFLLKSSWWQPVARFSDQNVHRMICG